MNPDLVSRTRDGLPDPAEIERLAEWHRLLADPTRLRLLFALVDAGELCVGDLAEVIGAPEATVSQALRHMRAGRVVRSRRAGRLMLYALDDHHVAELLALGREHVGHDHAGP